MHKKSNPSGIYNVVKAITALLVVFGHCAVMYTSDGAFSPLNHSWILEKTAKYIYLFHMPLFMFVSGAVYGLCIQQSKYEDTLEFIRNKIKRLLIPYFSFRFLYVAPAVCLMGVTDQDYFSYCLSGIVLSMNSRHLWFLLALFHIFMFAIFLRKWILKSRYTQASVLLLSCAVYILAKYVPVALQLRKACSYQFFFILGTLFHFYFEQAEADFVKCRYLLVVLPIILLASFFYNPGQIVACCYNLTGILMIMMLVTFLEQKKQISKTKFFQHMADTSMGIFLFHPMIIYLGYYWLGGRDIPAVVLAIGIFLASCCISILLTKGVRLLGLGMLLGEQKTLPL